MKRVSYTQKTLAELRRQGAVVDVCERWIPIPKAAHPAGGVRRDLFGLFDIIALMGGRIIGIQSTSEACRSAHAKTILGSDNLKPWVAAGGRVELWTWKKVAHGKTNRYVLRVAEIEGDSD